MEPTLHDTEWDCCVIGNGVAALWASHRLWSSRKSVLWIASDDPFCPERAMLARGWLWGVSDEAARKLAVGLQGFDTEGSASSFEAIYFDARSTRRFHRLDAAKREWGAHESGLLDGLAGATVDLWPLHDRLFSFHDGGARGMPARAAGPGAYSRVELFAEPRFARVTGLPVRELLTEGDKIIGAALGSKGEAVIRAENFYLGDFDESLPALIRAEEKAKRLSSALRTGAYRAGFGLRLWHRDFETAPTQTVVTPLVANPSEKSALSHVAGRFVRRRSAGPDAAGSLESLWVCLLTDEELEDNNEILKKIKQAKRALDRAMPGFAASISREAVTFEPRMRAERGVAAPGRATLGARLISDYSGPEALAQP